MTNRWWVEILESFFQRDMRLPTFIKNFDARGRRLALATTALMSPPMHPEARLEGESLDFHRKARVSRRAGVIDSRLLSIRLRSEEDECRLYIKRSPALCDVPGFKLVYEVEFSSSS